MQLIKFYSHTCAPCKQMAPIIADVMSEFPSFDVSEVDVGTGCGRTDASTFNIRGVPSFVILNSDGFIVDTKTGVMTKESFRKFITDSIS